MLAIRCLPDVSVSVPEYPWCRPDLCNRTRECRGSSMISLSETWTLLRNTVLSFIEDDALSRGAAIAFFTVTSIAPVLLIVIAIAGLAFGHDAAQNALTSQLGGLMGQQTAEVLQSAVASAAGKSSGIIATVVGVLTLFATASGVFGEMQSALNAIWKAKPQGTTVSRLIRARVASLGLVASLGFLLIVSLVVSAALAAFGSYLNAILPFGSVLLGGVNFVVSLVLISILFGAIYKVLPDRDLEWRDVAVGAVVPAGRFTHAEIPRLRSRWTGAEFGCGGGRPEEIPGARRGGADFRTRCGHNTALHQLRGRDPVKSLYFVLFWWAQKDSNLRPAD
jgi:membrane protein